MSLVITTAQATLLAAAGTADNPILAWDNMAARATIIRSNRAVLPDGALLNAADGNTWDAWQPISTTGAGAATFELQMPAAAAPTFFALIGHNLADIGVTQVTFSTSTNGTTWAATVATLPAASMNGVCDGCWFPAGTARVYLRIVIEGIPANALPVITGVFIGDVIQMPQRLYAGFAPIITPTEIELMANSSDGGQFMGAAVVRRGSSLALPIEHLSPGFLRGAAWKAFQTAFNEGQPLILAWRPTRWPDDLHYCRREGAVLRPVNMGVKDYMQIELQARVYEG